MDIVTLPVEHDESIDSRFRLVAMAAQRSKELVYGAKPKVKTKFKKPTTIAIEEALEGQLEFIVGEEAMVANEKARKLDYRRFLEERRKEAASEDLSELEKDLRVYLHEREEADKLAFDELFAEKKEESEENTTEE